MKYRLDIWLPRLDKCAWCPTVEISPSVKLCCQYEGCSRTDALDWLEIETPSNS
jgi:hypothetical protein